MKVLFLAITLFLGLSALPALADTPVNTGTFGNTAIGGYDTVAYFEQGTPVKGDKKIVTEWNGAEWRFSSEENKQLFVANPEKYAPQYGGYCAYALGVTGDLVSTDPQAWHIQDGKLYLNYSLKVREQWLLDKDNYITKANVKWSERTSK